jgi:hypothetical protein
MFSAPSVFLVLCGALMCGAGNAAPGSPDEPRSPAELSIEQRREMMRDGNTYHTCIYQHAIANIDASEDIRRIADIALGECQILLDALDGKISGWGYPQPFAARFTRKIRAGAVHKLLPELAMRKSQ